MLKKEILLLPLIIFLFILITFFYLLKIERNPSEIPSNLINKNVPILEAESLLKKDTFISSQEFGREIIIVNFFATWCKPCRDEHKFIKRFSSKNKIRVIGINYNDNSKKTVQWLKKLGNPYSNIPLDKNGSIAIEWGVYGIPETFIVNSNSMIKYRHVGPINKNVYNKIIKMIKNMK